jgi:adenine-specific DNA-methyltransferase
MTEEEIRYYLHGNKRLNNPQVGLVTPHTDAKEERASYGYDPHIAPSLQFDSARARVERLIDETLDDGSPEVLRAALEELKRASGAFLEWTGKAERTSFEVPTVSLHVHERLDPATIIEAARRHEAIAPIQGDLFESPFIEAPFREEVEFYKHERGWANRLVAGDSLLVMNSLLAKEGMAGKVQMIYIDPPYGIKYGSNFQPFVNKRDVKDGADDDLTREPEQIRAFRDTWELGIHSYLTYLRDRLWLAKDLLAESGSVFVQISDENLHHVRELMDEVFGPDCFVVLIAYRRLGAMVGARITSTAHYLIWYCKNSSEMKYRKIFDPQIAGVGTGDRYTRVERIGTGSSRPLQAEELVPYLQSFRQNDKKFIAHF